MKIRPSLLITTGLVIISAIFLFQYGNKEKKSADSNQSVQSLEEERENQHPGFYEEWFELKKNEEGIIPNGLLTKWHQHDLRIKNENPGSPARTNSSTYLGPFGIGGRTRAILVDQANNSRYFAGGVSGGLWYSNNSGTSWSPINDMAASLSVTCITQNPFNPDEIYYGTGEALGNSAMLRGTGVFYSDNGGQDFALLTSTENNSDFTICNDIEHSKIDNDKVYVATNSGLYLSSDSGASWSLITDAYKVFDIISFPQPTGGVLITTENGLFYSADGSSNFILIVDSNFPNFDGIKIANCEDFPDVVYALFTDGYINFSGFFKSTDAGQTWVEQIPPQGGSYGGYCYTLGVHKSNPDYVVAGGIGLRYSTNGGQTWANAISAHADNHAVEIIPDSPNEVLIGNDGGVYKYDWSTLGSAFTDLNNGYNVTQFYKGNYKSSDKEAVAGSQDNGTFAMDASGGVNQDLTSGDGISCFWGKINPNLAYLSTQKGRIFRRTDFVNDTYDCSNVNPSADCFHITLEDLTGEESDFLTNFEVNRLNEDELFATTFYGLWRLNWTGSSPVPYDVQKLNSNNLIGLKTIALESTLDPTLYTGGTSGKFYRVDNASSAGASDIVNLSGNVPDEVDNQVISDIAIDPTNTDVVYAGFSSYDEEPRIYKVCNAKTTDPEASPSEWTSIAGDLPPQLPVNTVAVDSEYPDEIIFIGTDFGLYYTLDGGQVWEKENSIPNVPIFDIRMRHSDRHLFVFSHGRGAWVVEVDDVPTSTTLDITGNIHTEGETNSGVGLVNIDLCNFTTPASGDYICPDQDIGAPYTITPFKDVFHVNGVSSFDIIIINKHILQIELLDSPYKMIAADVFPNNNISNFDLIQIRQLILYIITEFPNNTSWRFVPDDYVFPDPLIPFDTPFPESITICNLSPGNAGDNNFVGIKIGDVNNSANPSMYTGGGDVVDTRSNLLLKIEDRKLSNGEIISIPVMAENFEEKVAYQFKLDIDQDYLEVVEWKEGSLSGFDKENFAYDNGQLRTLWVSNEEDLGPVSLRENTSLFTLTLKAKKEVSTLSKVISMDVEDSYNAAYDEQGRGQNILLSFDKKQVQVEESLTGTSSVQVYPTPFKEQLSITYPASFTNGRIEILNTQGQMIKRIKEAKQTLRLGDLVPGTYFLHFISDEGTSVEKILKQ